MNDTLNNIELSLLASDSIPFYNIGNIHPFTIGDIKNMGGETVFNSYIGALTISKDKFNTNVDGDDQKQELNMSDFELAYTLCLTDMKLNVDNKESYFKDIYLKAMSLIFKEEINMCDIGFYVGDINQNRIIDSSNYDELINIVKLQNCLVKMGNTLLEENPSSDKARELLEKRRRAREKLNKIKNKDNEGSGEPLTLSDLVSILCANGNGVTIFNVWDLSFYAFNDQFNRMKMFDDYQVNIRSILAGADPKEVELKHWMSKID